MFLYHGSVVPVEKPEIINSSAYLDFGVGFYTTTSYKQAERWAKIKMRRCGKNLGYISVYEFDIDEALKAIIIHKFECADERWLEFVVGNRNGWETGVFADVYVGPVANDSIYRSIRLFETGAYDAQYTVQKLKTEVLQDQWTFHTEKSLSYIDFKGCKEVF